MTDQGRFDVVRIDPASTARTGIGPSAYSEFERVFGSRILARAPRHGVGDALDFMDALLCSGNLVIHPHLYGSYRKLPELPSQGTPWRFPR